jgi:hypothetical protein
MMDEGKKDKRPVQAPAPAPEANKPGLIVKTCELFDQTYQAHVINNHQLSRKLSEFVKFKTENPIKPFGKKDYGDSNTSRNYDRQVPGMKHSHLTDDISVWYTINGTNPRVLKLYAMLSHDESGTGEPKSNSRQRGMAARMANQAFD